jgi:hypothetical protein
MNRKSIGRTLLLAAVALGFCVPVASASMDYNGMSQEGFTVAPVALHYNSADHLQVGYGSFLVNQNACYTCHSPTLAGKGTGPIRFDYTGYFGGECFAKGFCTKDLSPDMNGFPGGYDLPSFISTFHNLSNGSFDWSSWMPYFSKSQVLNNVDSYFASISSCPDSNFGFSYDYLNSYGTPHEYYFGSLYGGTPYHGCPFFFGANSCCANSPSGFVGQDGSYYAGNGSSSSGGNSSSYQQPSFLHTSSHLSDADLAAIYDYLRSIPSVPQTTSGF